MRRPWSTCFQFFIIPSGKLYIRPCSCNLSRVQGGRYSPVQSTQQPNSHRFDLCFCFVSENASGRRRFVLTRLPVPIWRHQPRKGRSQLNDFLWYQYFIYRLLLQRWVYINIKISLSTYISTHPSPLSYYAPIVALNLASIRS